MSAAPTDVTVIGLGPMGQAMVRVLLRAGMRVTVWNRTASRADGLVADGAVRAPTPADALTAAPLVILSLTDYPAMYAILDDARPSLAGRTIVNLSSDTPEATRAAAAWAAEHGAGFLAGGVMVPAPMLGTDAAYVYYSGPRELLDAHAPVLRTIGAPRYVGADPGLAQVAYLAQLAVFLTALSGLLQGAALTSASGAPLDDFVRDALGTLAGIPAMLEEGRELLQQLDTGVHPGDLSTVLMMGATAGHIVAAGEVAGIDTELARAVQRHYQRAIAAGHGRANWTALYEVIAARN